jgi:hypothetical protein
MKNFACSVFIFASAVFAQQSGSVPPPAIFGQVTGRVICGDTSQPGRFASVQLISEHPSTTPMIDPATLGKNPDLGKAMASAMNALMKGSNLSTLTGIDGSFSLEKVPAGTYYVVSQLPGYQSPLSQFSMAERMKADDATLKAVEDAAEKIVVQPGQAAHVDLRLERGATLSGSVRYDDGSPATSVTPVLMGLQKDGKWKDLTIALLPVMTDDRGHYRFYGLPAGKYAVKAALPTIQAMVGVGSGAGAMSMHMDTGDALVVYSGGVLRDKDVKPVEIGVGDEVDGIDIVFPISDLHTISGSVVAKADNHAIDAGTVALIDPDTKASLRSAMIERDGSFHMNYVPSGQYIVRVTGGADTESPAGSEGQGDFARMLSAKTIKSYGGADQTLLLKSDTTNLVLQVPDPPAKGASGN